MLDYSSAPSLEQPLPGLEAQRLSIYAQSSLPPATLLSSQTEAESDPITSLNCSDIRRRCDGRGPCRGYIKDSLVYVKNGKEELFPEGFSPTVCENRKSAKFGCKKEFSSFSRCLANGLTCRYGATRRARLLGSQRVCAILIGCFSGALSSKALYF